VVVVLVRRKWNEEANQLSRQALDEAAWETMGTRDIAGRDD
jgi:hypothetical protein